ncbi:carbohydrate ABC transporter permease [Pontibacillus litoralis]|uniref:ABC transporter permease n=1 Tax=Pontibacillus litoralis JSM 072002 TaxID=1385512 RepID=A0A0A5FXW4_9BACI|nr:sugar ABC transporter permease [Pontibacillus litoralis]KGX85661.1 ABC transporter permease [Pontibacillus litoralis JSM 072002]
MFKKQTLKVNMYGYLFLLPALIFLILFTYYPTLLSIHDSFYLKDNLRPEGAFVGLDNYKYLLQDDVFQKVLWNNLIFAIGTVPTSIMLAMFMAVKLNKVTRINQWMKTSYFYPTVIPLVAVANIWLFIYQPDFGLYTRFADFFGLPDIPWLQSELWVMPAMIILTIWKEAGFFMIFFLAGLQNIPNHIYESASMEGASNGYVFRKLTFPLLMPTTLFVFIIALTNSVKTVDHIFVMTEGGPNNASNLILYYIYQNRFTFGDIGIAATASVILIVVLLAISLINFFVLDRKIHY